MNQEQVAAILRTALQVLAGIFAWSWLDTNTVAALASAVAGLGVVAWGIWARSNTNLVASAAAVPEVAKIETKTVALADAVPSAKVVKQ